MVENEHIPPDGRPHPLREAADLPGLLALVREVVRQIFQIDAIPKVSGVQAATLLSFPAPGSPPGR